MMFRASVYWHFASLAKKCMFTGFVVPDCNSLATCTNNENGYLVIIFVYMEQMTSTVKQK